MITEEQWELIDEKYGMLMAKICHKISGDKALCSYDDNLQDLRMDAMDAVDGYERQNDGANGTFDDDGEIVEQGIYSEKIYELNAPIIEYEKNKFKIIGYELNILNANLFEKLQEELMSCGSILPF